MVFNASPRDAKSPGNKITRYQRVLVLLSTLLIVMSTSFAVFPIRAIAQAAAAAATSQVTSNRHRNAAGAQPGSGDPNANIAPPGSGEDDNAAEEQAANEANEQAPYTQLVTELAEQDISFYQWLDGVLNMGNQGNGGTDTYQGLQYFFNQTIGLGWLPHIGELFAKWLGEVVTDWIGPVGAYLSGWVMEFVFNPDVSIGQDAFSTNVRTLALGVQDLSNDLLLLFFILGIWRYWTQAAWGGGQSVFSAVGRIIATAASIAAWPTLYHYAILISNSCINLFVPNKPNSQYANELGMAVYNAIKLGLTPMAFDWVSIPQALIQIPNIGIGAAVSVVAGKVAVSFIGLVLVLMILSALLVSLISFFILKITQIITVIGAFVFGPFFLVFLVSPDTEGYTSNFVKSFLEVILWTFIWSGFLKLLLVILNLPL